MSHDMTTTLRGSLGQDPVLSVKCRKGDANAATRPYGDFWAMVDKSGDCWIWTGYVQPNGYGFTRGVLGDGAVHRLAYEDLVGPIPEGLDVDHVCHNEDLSCPGGWECRHRRCVNPDHLEPVTRSENMRRANARVDRPEHCRRDGCDNLRHARGLCSTHYHHWWKARRSEVTT